MMLGWKISIYQLLEKSTVPATDKSPEGMRLAVWQTGLGGLDWINELVKEGKAIDLGGNGYPCRCTATAEHLIPHIVNGIPEAHSTWTFEMTDRLLKGWEGKTAIDHRNCSLSTG